CPSHGSASLHSHFVQARVLLRRFQVSAMRLTPEEESERSRIIDQASRVRTRAEIAETRAAVRAWLEQHPDDPSIDWALEPVAMIEECRDLEDAERAAA